MGKLDVCMFCEQAPCQCGKPVRPKATRKAAPKAEPKEGEAKAEPKPRATRAKAKPDPIDAKPKPNIMAAMKARAAEASTTTAAVKPVEKVEYVPKVADRTEVNKESFDRAIRALEPLLATSERGKYHAVLHSENKDSDRVREWKERNVGT